MRNARLDVARGPRFIFYANELIGLGQLRRTLALAARLSDSECAPSSLILTGSAIEPTFQLPPRVDTLKLPGRSRDQGGRQYSARLELNADELCRCGRASRWRRRPAFDLMWRWSTSCRSARRAS
jgi:predicted glycosyltransferase